MRSAVEGWRYRPGSPSAASGRDESRLCKSWASALLRLRPLVSGPLANAHAARRLQSTAWGGSSAGRASRSQCEGREFDPPPLHHYSAPNCSQLGVFICGFRPSRGAPGHSACASSSLSDRHHAPGSPLFRPIFSRNLRQLLRRGTRRRRCSSTTCARADANGCLAGLHEQCRTANPRGQHPRQPLGGNGSSP